MTVREREKLDRRFRLISKIAKYTRRHISTKLANMIQEWNDCRWEESFR